MGRNSKKISLMRNTRLQITKKIIIKYLTLPFLKAISKTNTFFFSCFLLLRLIFYKKLSTILKYFLKLVICSNLIAFNYFRWTKNSINNIFRLHKWWSLSHSEITPRKYKKWVNQELWNNSTKILKSMVLFDSCL